MAKSKEDQRKYYLKRKAKREAAKSGNSALTSDIQRAQQAVREGKRRNEVDAFKLEMRKSRMEIGGRTNPYQDEREIQRLAENQAVREFLPELGNTQKDARERQNRLAQQHEFKYGPALIRSVPDKNGVATFEIPVIHTFHKGATSTNGGVGSKRKKEEKLIKVRVNILK